MNSTSDAIVVKDLTRRFGAFVAVDRVSFSVKSGEIFGFLGSNGAGKSTTIRMLCGLLKPTSGTAIVGGVDVGRDPERVKAQIGYMSQKFSLYELLTVDQNIRLYAELYGVEPSRFEERRRFAIEMAGLAGRERAMPRDLPGGFRQRLALGCAILHEPQILFLDEPTSGVDPLSRRSFWELIASVAEGGVTVFVTTHYMDEAEHCDRLGLVFAGRLAALGTPAQLKERHCPAAIYEVQGVPLMRALDRLTLHPAVVEAAIHGTGLRVTAAPGAGEAEIAAALAASGVTAQRIEGVHPTLEDVFVAVVGEAGAAAAPAR